MTPDERLAGIVTTLESVGLTCLVMGGHAVRSYSLQRNSIDFDLYLVLHSSVNIEAGDACRHTEPASTPTGSTREQARVRYGTAAQGVHQTRSHQ